MSVYLDHAATTPMVSEAIVAMSEQLSQIGNPSSLHSFGRKSRSVVEQSRESLAVSLGCETSEIIFTSGGTESNNLAIKGLFWSRNDVSYVRKIILVSKIEHHAVLDAVLWLEKFFGAKVLWIPVDCFGLVDIDFIAASCKKYSKDIAFVSVMYANNEVGSVQNIVKIGEIVAQYGLPFHSDAVQAVGQVPFDFCESGLCAATISGHKIGGPFGVGVLLLKRTTKLVPLLHGGGQERKIRSGTLAVAAIKALAVAVEVAVKNQLANSAVLCALSQKMVLGIQKKVPAATLQGPADFVNRLPNNVHFTFAGCEGETLLFLLDSFGISSSTGAACNAGVVKPSHVLLAMGLSEEQARGAQRFTLGNTSVEGDVDKLLEVLPRAFDLAKQAGLAAGFVGTNI